MEGNESNVFRDARHSVFTVVVKPNIDLYDAFTGTLSLDDATRYIERVQPLAAVLAFP